MKGGVTVRDEKEKEARRQRLEVTTVTRGRDSGRDFGAGSEAQRRLKTVTVQVGSVGRYKKDFLGCSQQGGEYWDKADPRGLLLA